MKQGSKHKVIQSGVLVDCMSGGCPFHEMFCGKTPSRNLKYLNVLIHKSSTTEVVFESSVEYITTNLQLVKKCTIEFW